MNRIRELRLAAGLKQAEFGDRVNLAKSTISQYECETRQIDAPMINLFCDFFDVSADYLLGRSNTPRPALSDSDAMILAAYHSASLRDRALVDQILAVYLEDAKNKNAG